MLRGLLLLLGLQCLGELIKFATDSVIPGPVIGLLLLLALLMLRRGVPDGLATSTDWLLGRMPLLFVPPSVGLLFLAPSLDGQWLAIGSVVVVGTVITLLFSAALMQRLIGAERTGKTDEAGN